MKNTDFTKLTIILVAFIMVTGIDAFAQRGRMMVERRDERGVFVCPYIPDLTEEQQSQINELRTAHLKEMTEFRNRINENRAQYRSLITGTPADRSDINANIDEYTETRNQMMKRQAAHRQEIRNVLTEEQRVYFDARAGSRRGQAMMHRGAQRRSAGHPSRTPMMRRGW